MDITDITVQTADGRTLAVQTGGDPDGRPVLVQNGTPNSRHLYGPHLRDAADRGLRLISYDRPGYGGSSPHPGHTVADGAADVRAICGELGISRAAIWGISGGGPYTLACAALLPGLVTAAASLASLAPYGASGLDWFAGMGQANVDDIQLYFKDQDAARVQLEEQRAQMLAAAPEDLAGGMESLVSPADAAVLTGDLAVFMASSFQDGLTPGGQGWWDDGAAHVGPWGFELSSIAVPVLVMHGRQDQFVPFGHGEWLASQIPGVTARLLEDDGHLTLFANRIPEVHAWLAEHL